MITDDECTCDWEDTNLTLCPACANRNFEDENGPEEL